MPADRAAMWFARAVHEGSALVVAERGSVLVSDVFAHASRVVRGVEVTEFVNVRLGEPLDGIFVDRAGVSDAELGATLNVLSLHVATSGVLAMHGWTPSELPSVPPCDFWRGPDSRAWVPLFYENVFMAWQCVGAMTDA